MCKSFVCSPPWPTDHRPKKPIQKTWKLYHLEDPSMHRDNLSSYSRSPKTVCCLFFFLWFQVQSFEFTNRDLTRNMILWIRGWLFTISTGAGFLPSTVFDLWPYIKWIPFFHRIMMDTGYQSLGLASYAAYSCVRLNRPSFFCPWIPMMWIPVKKSASMVGNWHTPHRQHTVYIYIYTVHDFVC